MRKYRTMKSFEEVEVPFHSFLTSALEDGGLPAYRSGYFYFKLTALRTQCIGDWLGSSAVLDSVE
jgi:hypothetical protein